MDIDTSVRLARMQQRIYACIRDELQRDGHHKSNEGAMEVTMHLPDMFAQSEGVTWSITLYAYVLDGIDGRSAMWSGRTLAEAVAVAEHAIEKICFGYEMARFHREMEQARDDQSDDELF